MIVKRSFQGRSPENFENQDSQIRIFNVLVNDSTHLLQEKVGLRYMQSFLRSEEIDRGMGFLTRTMP